MNHLVRPCQVAFMRTRIIIGPPVVRVQANRTFSLTSTKNQDFKPSEELAKERYDTRADEPIEKKRARLLYQSKKRGMLENGVILASFADKFLNKFDAEQLDQYDRLINLPTNDWDIYYWATKTKPTPPEFETPIMRKLREHLNSKVSSSSNDEFDDNKDKSKKEAVVRSILDGRHGSDIVMPAVKKKYNLDIDASQISLIDYKEELFDNRIIKYRNRLTVARMTDWRRKYFVKRIRRTISSPISLRNISDDKQAEVFTQRVNKKDIATGSILHTHLVDSTYDRSIKHHNFLQHLMSSEFTDNVHDYDDEAEAWADAVWHRNYGSADVTIAPSYIKCVGCNAKLHCCDPGLQGYMPKELFAALKETQSTQSKCQRCKFSDDYNILLGVDVPNKDYVEMMKQLRDTQVSIVCVLVDLTDFPCSIWGGLVDLIGQHHRIIVIGNKVDLLPNDGPRMLSRVTNSLKRNLAKIRPGEKNLYVQDVMLMSARTGFGVEALVARLFSLSEAPKNIYLLGCSNSGKSTLFNALLQSDISAIRKGDLLSRASGYNFPGTKLNMLKFPVTLAEGWEISMKKRRLERVERNDKVRERSLENTTKIRQATMPHMSMLIDRVEYLPGPSSTTSITNIDDGIFMSEEKPKFTDDHPMANITNRNQLSATKDEFNEHKFLYHTPSTSHPDQLHELLTTEERLEVFPHETITPRKFSIRPLQSIFISGLARLDLLTSNSNVIVTIFASKYLPVHVIPTRKADQFYYTFLGTPYLGVPFGDEKRLKRWPNLYNSQPDFHINGSTWNYGATDIVLSSTGWALINICQDHECIFRAFTPEGRGIYRRDPPLLPFAKNVAGRRKIRDTPLFVHPHYTIERVPA